MGHKHFLYSNLDWLLSITNKVPNLISPLYHNVLPMLPKTAAAFLDIPLLQKWCQYHPDNFNQHWGDAKLYISGLYLKSNWLYSVPKHIPSTNFMKLYPQLFLQILLTHLSTFKHLILNITRALYSSLSQATASVTMICGCHLIVAAAK